LTNPFQDSTWFAAGDIATLYRGRFRGRTTPALLKVPRDPDRSDLLEREAVALVQLVQDGSARFRPYAPQLVESFQHRDAATGAIRRANVIELAEGFRSLAEVRAAYPGGLDPRDVAWMWRRLLVALGYAHRAGVIHGAVLPEHVLIHPEDHGLVLVDWCCSVSGCYAAKDPSGLVPAVVRRLADAGHYPPEVLSRRRASPATDVFMATRCMTGLLGDGAPRSLRAFADGCTLQAPSRRPGDAWRLLGELDDVLERLYGPRRFRPFAMPASGRL
jgi:serine/threonine protein kinase